MDSRHKLFSRKSAITAALTLGALIMGVAFASWTATGSGSGTAKSRTAAALTVSARTGADDLYPGFTNGDLHFTVANTNPYSVAFSSATLGTVTSSDAVNCPSANVTVDPSATGLSLVVPANSAGTDLSIPDVVNMLGTAPDGCQGKSFTIAVTLSGTQS